MSDIGSVGVVACRPGRVVECSRAGGHCSCAHGIRRKRRRGAADVGCPSAVSGRAGVGAIEIEGQVRTCGFHREGAPGINTDERISRGRSVVHAQAGAIQCGHRGEIEFEPAACGGNEGFDVIVADVVGRRTSVIVKGTVANASHAVLHIEYGWHDGSSGTSDDGLPSEVYRGGIGSEAEGHAAACSR